MSIPRWSFIFTQNDDRCGSIPDFLILSSGDLYHGLSGRVFHGDLPQDGVAVVRHHYSTHWVHQHLQIGRKRKERKSSHLNASTPVCDKKMFPTVYVECPNLPKTQIPYFWWWWGWGWGAGPGLYKTSAEIVG